MCGKTLGWPQLADCDTRDILHANIFTLTSLAHTLHMLIVRDTELSLFHMSILCFIAIRYYNTETHCIAGMFDRFKREIKVIAKHYIIPSFLVSHFLDVPKVQRRL